MIAHLLSAVADQVPAPRPNDGPKVSALFLLIPAAVIGAIGIWGWRNAERQANSISSLDERTKQRRFRTYQRGSVFCLVVAAAFVVLMILSFLSLGSPR